MFSFVFLGFFLALLGDVDVDECDDVQNKERTAQEGKGKTVGSEFTEMTESLNKVWRARGASIYKGLD